MRPRVVLVVLCVLAASMLALVAGAADQQLRAGGESVVGIDHGDDRTTPPGTESQAGETPTPTTSPTSDPTDDDGSTGGSTGGSDGDPAGGGSEDPAATPTPEPTTNDREESTPSATVTESGTAEPTPRDATATETDAETDTITDSAPDERAGLSLPGLGTGLWVVAGITVVLVLATVAARRR